MAVKQLHRAFDASTLKIETTHELPPLDGIIGQPRAVAAIELGLNIRQPGFNIYVSGPPGIGKMTAVRAFLEKIAVKRDAPPDWCYVNNFSDSYQPRILRLPAGQAPQFQLDMKALIDTIRQGIPRAFEGDSYGVKREEIGKVLDADRSAEIDALTRLAAEAGHVLQPTPFGLMIVPLRGKRPLRDHEMEALPPEERRAIQEKRGKLEDKAKGTMKRIRELERAAQQKVKDLDRQVALSVIGGPIEDLLEKYGDVAEVPAYLNALRDDVVQNLDAFRTEPGEAVPPALKAFQSSIQSSRERVSRQYSVNVAVTNDPGKGAPVVVELNPTFTNLLGHVEKEAHMGALVSDFTMIKPGALHRANGGFLVVPVEDVLRNAFSWDGLKRSLRAGEIAIEEIGERLGLYASAGLKPQPVPLDVKVVLLGRPYLFHLLTALDPEFRELFKVKADFDTQFDRNDRNVRDFLGFLCTFCTREKILPLDRGAIARVVEHASRLAEDREKISLNFGQIADLVRESDYWAREDASEVVQCEHVRRAIDQKVYRSDMIKSRIQELIARGTLLFDLEGEAVGQVNGLSVIQLGDYEFGRPSRITAQVGPGREGVMDIEREVELGGPIHSKGVMILSGFLAGRFAAERPLNLAARLVFEQSYDGIEGDSASSGELYAILSALSGVPIRQGIAVTGSVNQNGEVQAIGGANEKIEGFFEVCRQKGLNGKQGVLLPRANLSNLMLREDVVDAVKEKKFAIWAVSTIDEGIAILTGKPAGARGKDGKYPAGTVNALVDARICRFTECVRDLEAKKIVARKAKKAEVEARGGSRRR
ncbi:MAG: AAA family ATPase [Planctomycetes bacterium]|nr:AAA family ATPase [Planctomycetota bacterium]